MSIPRSDSLRTPDEAYLPDSRSPMFGLKSIEDQFNRIKVYELSNDIPEKIITQYEVARNIYLYAYNAYRFYMVSRHQALIVLEYAIKERYGREEIAEYGKSIKKGRGLAACLRYVFDKGFVVNEDFQFWRDRRRADAQWKYELQKIEEMERKGLNEIDLDFDEIDYEKHTLEWDYREVLSETMPSYRNEHAHGSSILTKNVLDIFENVSTIINKIYERSK